MTNKCRAGKIALILVGALTIPLHAVAADAPAATDQAAAADQEADLAKKLSNPIAALISVPFKVDFDSGIGTADAGRTTFVVQPVIPISLGEDWNVISRTIVPFVDAQSPTVGGDSASGMADILQSLFFSPKAPTASGWIWGAGPAVSLPTGNSSFGSGKWSLGPTAVLLKQESGWTYGVLVNQLWSVAGSSSRDSVSAAFVQPFLSYTTPTFTTIGLNTETSYNWQTSQATVPINVTVSQLVKLGGQPVSFLFGGRVYANRPSGGPDWGLRFQVTLLFPK